MALGPGIASAAEGDWTQYRYAPTKNAVVHSGLDDLLDDGVDAVDQVRSTPVVADGKLFVGNHGVGALQSFDLATGDELWREQAPNWVHSEMIYADGTIFVGFGNRFAHEEIPGVRGSGDSGVLALDAETGAQLWRFDTVGEVMPTPVVVNGAVYAVTGDQTLYKIDPASGDELHRTDIGHVVSMSSPAEHDGKLFFGAGAPAPYSFFSYDTATDEFAWSREFGEFNRGLDDVPPAVDEDIVVTTANAVRVPGSSGMREEHTIVAMNEMTGEELWRKSLGTGPAPTNNRSGAPTIDGGKVFVGSPTTSAAYAFDLHTGAQLWRNPVGAIKGAPVIDGNDAYFSTKSGEVFRLDVATGAITGKLQLEGALAPAGPIIVDDTLVVPSQNKRVYFTPLDEFPDFTVPEGSLPTAGSSGSAHQIGGSLGVDVGSLDAAY